MGDDRDIEQIRDQIAVTRWRLRETSEALGHKADLPARTISLVGDAAELAGEWLRGRVSEPRPTHRTGATNDGPGLTEKAAGAISSMAGTATGAVAEGASSAAHAVAHAAGTVAEGVKSGAGTTAGAASRAADHVPGPDDAKAHPMLVGALALAAGLVAGLAIPATRAEQRAAQPLADEAREAADRLAERASEAVAAG